MWDMVYVKIGGGMLYIRQSVFLEEKHRYETGIEMD